MQNFHESGRMRAMKKMAGEKRVVARAALDDKLQKHREDMYVTSSHAFKDTCIDKVLFVGE